MLDENPSRVDFISFWRGQRYVIEIDGPSHYATLEDGVYVVDERMYARNLKNERSLRRANWPVTRIGRAEVRDAMENEDRWLFGSSKLLSVLPFYPNAGYPQQYPSVHLVEEFGRYVAATDDFPF